MRRANGVTESREEADATGMGPSWIVRLSTSVVHADGVKRRIEIVVAGAPSDAASLEEAIAAPLNRLHADVHYLASPHLDPRDVITPTTAPASASVRIWFDIEIRRLPTIYMADESWERVLVRRVPLEHGLDEVGREALAFLTGSSVDAMLSGAQIGFSREEAKEVIGLGSPASKDSAEDAESRAAPQRPTWGFGLWNEAKVSLADAGDARHRDIALAERPEISSPSVAHRSLPNARLHRERTGRCASDLGRWACWVRAQHLPGKDMVVLGGIGASVSERTSSHASTKV